MVRLRGLASQSDPQSAPKEQKVGRFVSMRLRGLNSNGTKINECLEHLVSVGQFGPPDLKRPNSDTAWYLSARKIDECLEHGREISALTQHGSDVHFFSEQIA